MWNSHAVCRISLILRNTAFRRIAIALGFSVILHALVIGQFYLAVPDVKNDDNQVIVAQLVKPESPINSSPAVVAVPKEMAQPKKLVKHNKSVSSKKQEAARLPAPLEKMDTVRTEVVQQSTEITAARADGNGVSEGDVASSDQDLASKAANQTPPEPSVGGDALNSNQAVFKYVEMHFAVFTDKELASGGSSVGDAAIVYEQLPETSQYKIKSTVHAKGLASLFIPDLLQISQGNVTNKGLQPTYYLYQFGDKKNKTYEANFDWQAGQLHLHNIKVDKSLTLAEGTQDLLSFMYQFMFVQPLQTMQLSVTNGKKLGIYTYVFEGEEALESKIGALKTIHLARASSESEKKTELWLAIDYQYVPVKIRETDKDGKVYELLVTSLKTNQ